MQKLIRPAMRAALPLACLAALVFLIRPNGIPYSPVLAGLVAAALAVTLVVQTRGWLQNALVMTATLCVGFAIVEGVLEAQEPRVDLVLPGMAAGDPDFGVRAARAGPREVSETIDGKPIYRVVYTLDDALRRATRSPAGAPRTRFFGDSYTFGVGVADADTLPQAFADASGMNVENYGFPGYSPAQTLLAMQTGRFDADLAGAKLLVLQTAPWHVERTACLPQWTGGAPRYVLKDGALALQGRCISHRWQSLATYQRLLRPLLERPTHAAVETYMAVVDGIIDLARTKYKTPLAILTMGRDEPAYLQRTGFTPADLDAHFRERGAIVVEDATTAPLASLRIAGDNHPNAAANRLLAQALVEAAAGAGVPLPKVRDAGATDKQATTR